MVAFSQTSPGFGSGLGSTNRMYSSTARLKPLYASSSSLDIGGYAAAECSFKGTLNGSVSKSSIYNPRVDLRSLSTSMGRKRNTAWKPAKQTYWESKIHKQRAAMQSSGLFQLDPLPPKSLALAMGLAPLSSISTDPISAASSQRSSAMGKDSMLSDGAQDHDSWLSATLSSLPSPRRVVDHSNESRSLSDADHLHIAQRLPPNPPPKIAKKGLRIMFEADEDDAKMVAKEVMPKAKRKAKRTATQFGVKGGRSVAEVLERDSARVAVAQGFTDRELARMRNAFRRYRPPDSTEVNREDLAALFVHLGYFAASAEKVDELASDVHEFTTFSFHEFVDVAEKFVSYERDQLLALFRKYSSDDKSGESDRLSVGDSPSSEQTLPTPSASPLFPDSPKRFNLTLETPKAKPYTRLSVEKLPSLMYELGIIPLKETISEVLASSWDGRQRNSLTYDDFIRFMAVYRVTEGFKKEDIQRAQRVFRSYAKADPNTPDVLEMGANDLSSALITLFGTYSSTKVETLVSTLNELEEQECESDAEVSEPSSPQSMVGEVSANKSKLIRRCGVAFHEFLIWGRRTLNALMEELHRDFEQHADGRGRIDREDLLTIMAGLGFTLTQIALSEYLEDTDLSEEDDFDFDQFYIFVCAVRERSGFTREEAERLRLVFEKYDYDGSGEIENMELLDLLRFLGYDTSLEDVYRFLAEVDANANGSMDMQEFLRNLRVKREEDVAHVREGFQKFCEPITDEIYASHVGLALASVNQEVQEDILKKALATQDATQETLDFDTFLTVSDMCRTEMAHLKRKRAAFNQSDYEKLRCVFTERCSDGASVLQKGEWLWLLKDLGIPIDFQDDRKRVYTIVEEAWNRAVASGVDEDDLGEKGGETITLWVFLHVVRCILRDKESHTVTREEGAMDKARFTRVEVNEFREVFKASVLRHRLSGDSVDRPNDSATMDSLSKEASSVALDREPRPSSSRNPRSKLTLMLGVANYGFLPVSAFFRLLSSISIDFNLDEQRKIKQKVSEITTKDDFSLDFADFLLVMRWILDENLGDCQAKFALGSKNNRIRGMSSDSSRRRQKRKSI